MLPVMGRHVVAILLCDQKDLFSSLYGFNSDGGKQKEKLLCMLSTSIVFLQGLDCRIHVKVPLYTRRALSPIHTHTHTHSLSLSLFSINHNWFIIEHTYTHTRMHAHTQHFIAHLANDTSSAHVVGVQKGKLSKGVSAMHLVDGIFYHQTRAVILLHLDNHCARQYKIERLTRLP